MISLLSISIVLKGALLSLSKERASRRTATGQALPRAILRDRRARARPSQDEVREFEPDGSVRSWKRANCRMRKAGKIARRGGHACARFAGDLGHAVRALALILAGALPNPASAQQPPPRIWDVQLPTPVSDLPEEEFVDPACGTNGGPPGLAIGTFERFERCRPEASGLREIAFRYDDELEFIARAARDPDAIARNNAMVVLGQPVTLSLLIDRSGLVQGYRIFTDPHADEDLRAQAYAVAIAFKARFGADGWACANMPAAEGETPILGAFVKERCEKAADGLAITVESRHYYKPGQAMLDPNTGLPMVNQFESSARLQVMRAAALGK
jgi:hypothetical protein